ncbi:hypothetical protein [Desulfobacter curvatus]|uniref:hypothetical protein n=1 Tax=Desulfobacter curvatus TaxID=2290 RepID=UPI00035F8554|nr:hypothetical protein [Desulfobacter curvatus]
MSQAVAEAIEQNQRENGLDRSLEFYSQKKKMSDDEKNLYIKALHFKTGSKIDVSCPV